MWEGVTKNRNEGEIVLKTKKKCERDASYRTAPKKRLDFGRE
jgi:ribosomal protein L24E